MALQPVSPDALYCVYCHAVAAGACAQCGALCCGECAELVMGLTKPRAVCRSCVRAGNVLPRERNLFRVAMWIFGGAALAATALLAWARFG